MSKGHNSENPVAPESWVIPDPSKGMAFWQSLAYLPKQEVGVVSFKTAGWRAPNEQAPSPHGEPDLQIGIVAANGSPSPDAQFIDLSIQPSRELVSFKRRDLDKIIEEQGLPLTQQQSSTTPRSALVSGDNDLIRAFAGDKSQRGVFLRAALPKPFKPSKLYLAARRRQVNATSKHLSLAPLTTAAATWLERGIQDFLNYCTDTAEWLDEASQAPLEIETIAPEIAMRVRAILEIAYFLTVVLTHSWSSRLSLVRCVECGESKYLTKTCPITVFFERPGLLWVEGFSPTFVGHGRSLAKGLADFGAVIHATYQRLRQTPDHEFTPDEIEKYRLLAEHLDLQKHEAETPFTLHRVGRIVRAHAGHARRVKWEDGGHDRISLAMATGNFAGMSKGTRFVALLEYHSRTKKLQRMLECSSLPSGKVRDKKIIDWWEQRGFHARSPGGPPRG
jgi:hypothetical protein